MDVQNIFINDLRAAFLLEACMDGSAVGWKILKLEKRFHRLLQSPLWDN